MVTGVRLCVTASYGRISALTYCVALTFSLNQISPLHPHSLPLPASTAIFAFGPVDSGKTFTMFGVESHVIAGELTERTSGLVQRCGREVFRLLALEGGDASAGNPSFEQFPADADRPRGGTRPATAPVGSPHRPPLSRHDRGGDLSYDGAVIGDSGGYVIDGSASGNRWVAVGRDGAMSRHPFHTVIVTRSQSSE
jgi:hypothetical protein